LKRNSETLFLIVLFFASWGFLYATLGKPTSWDELLYIDLGIFPRADGTILNRWAHIYLQKLFLDLAPTPLQGAKLYWGFLISATMIIVYCAAKLLRKGSNYFNGVAGLLFFTSSALIFSYAGNTYADYTAMFFVALGVLVYLAFFRINPPYRWLLLIFFGFILFAATKSKESGIILAILIIGFGINQNQFEFKNFLKNFTYIFIGIGLGFGMLALLDYIFVNNALASVGSQQLSQYSYFAFRAPSLETGLLQRISFIVDSLSDIGLPWMARIVEKLPLFSLLYAVTFTTLVIGLQIERKRNWFELFVWILPIAFLGLLTLGRVKSTADRNFFPMHPILAILVAQFFAAEIPANFRDSFSKIWAFIKKPSGAIIISLLVIYTFFKYGPKFQAIYLGFVVAVAEILILLMAVLVKKWKSLHSTLAILLVGVFSFYGIVFDNLYPLTSGQRAVDGEIRFAPLAAIVDTFQCSPNTRIYVSANVVKQFEIFSRTLGFNVYFECKLTGSQFTFPTDLNLPEDLVDNNLHSYAYLTAAEFEELSPSTRSELLAQYNPENIQDGELVVLTNITGN
jgi:hypothetical protein